MLEILKISKKFVNSEQPVLDEVSLRIEEGECLSLLGPSGCGKTTLLRILAGLENPDQGRLLLDGHDIGSLPISQRPFRMVFQKHALFPHLSVFENVAFGLRIQKMPEAEMRRRVQEVLELVRMQDFANRAPDTLSGGQSQRVALARALAGRPQVLLLDEPFSALDLKLREGMATELRDLQKRMRLTFIFVTHDQLEAFALSDRVALMNQGRFEQVSTPAEIYHHPCSLYAAHFVGSVSQFPVDEILTTQGSQVSFQSEGQTWLGQCLKGPQHPGTQVALVRPECFRLVQGQNLHSDHNQVSVRLKDWIFRGSHFLLRAQTSGGTEILIMIQGSELAARTLEPGTVLNFCFPAQQTLIRTRLNGSSP